MDLTDSIAKEDEGREGSGVTGVNHWVSNRV